LYQHTRVTPAGPVSERAKFMTQLKTDFQPSALLPLRFGVKSRHLTKTRFAVRRVASDGLSESRLRDYVDQDAQQDAIVL